MGEYGIPDGEVEKFPYPQGWYVADTEAGTTHVVPLNDLKVHDPNDCWCHPTWSIEYNRWVHHAMDKREEFEEGRKAS